jgi:hypothetical protein
MAECTAYSLWISPAIKNSIDHCSLIGVDPVIDRERKALGKQTMETEHPAVYTCIEHQRVNVGEKAILEIIAQSRFP